MLDLYTANTTNGQRASIIVLEAGLPYELHYLDMAKREHKAPEYLAINPNGWVPALVDRDGPGAKPLTLTQSIGIILYLAEKSGKFIPEDEHHRIIAQEWCLFLATDLYPPFAAMYFMNWVRPKPLTDASKFFNEVMLLRFQRLSDHLADRDYVVGDAYSVADIAAYPMCVLASRDFPPVRDFANVQRWMAGISKRPAVVEAMSWFGGSGPELHRAPTER